MADPTLSIDLSAITKESKNLSTAIRPGTKKYDVIIVGSGAAGGMEGD